MKNFSAKNAEFETVKINNQAAISASDLGAAPNQIPLNKDLGSLAYQDAVNLDDVSADMLELRAIAAEISDSAVDVFVYDTSRDSDGGAWRKRTQHTSWYNEELNTTTRGARREFPAVAVIVAESKKVTVYDGDDPDLGMWMVFDSDYSVDTHLLREGISSVYVKNGTFSIGHNGTSNNNRLTVFNFIKETSRAYYGISVQDFSLNFSKRNQGTVGGLYRGISGVDDIVNRFINDVAMTILPNAPIDENTGLPVPTIAVATDGGVSVIKDDGTVVDYTCIYNANSQYSLINFIGDSKLLACSRDGKTYPTVFDIPSQDKASFDSTDIVFAANPSDGSSAADIRVGNYSDYKASAVTKENIAIGGESLIISNIDNVSGDQTADNVIISSSYNTGWMPGDIKLATLSDTTVEKIGVNSDNLLTNGDFSTDVTASDGETSGGWTSQSAGLSVNTSGQLVVQDDNNDSIGGRAYQMFQTQPGAKYTVSFEKISNSTSNGNVYISNGTSYGTNLGGIVGQPAGSYNITFQATSDSTYIILASESTAGGSAIFDNISVRATTELITNGDFSNGDDGSWAETSDPTLTVIDGGVNLKVLSGDNQAGFHQNFNASNIDQRYILSFEASDFTGDGAANLVVGYDDFWSTGGSLGTTQLISTKEDGFYSFSFYGRPGGMSILFRIYDLTGTCSVDTHMNIKNISVRPAEEDRSVNNNGLQIVGEIDKTPVASGADLVAYSGFSANNYLVQPYNEDLNFGTGDFSIMGWVKTNISSDYQTVLDFGLTTSGSRRHLAIAANTGELYMAIQGSNTMGTHSVSVANNSWSHCVVTVVGGTINFYINGLGVGSNNSLTLNSLDDSIGLRVGFGIDDQFVLNGSVSLLRISATVPTAEQIAKIYRDEKALFQDGAQATLYGSSDAVTALAYDDSEQLLHVGTASGRSDFRGLVRVNNTTTAISNSISAAEGTIIQN